MNKNENCVIIFSNTFWSIYNFRRSLIKALKEKGYHVIAISAQDEYIGRLKDLGCEIIVLKNFDAKSTGVLKEIKLIAEIVSTLRKIKCRYIFTFTIKPNLYTSLTSFLTSKKIILTVNGLGNAFSGGALIKNISLLLFKRAFKKADKIIFQNRDDFSFFKKHIHLTDKKVIFVRGSGVNINEFTFSPKQKAAGDELVFLLACRLLKEKGVFEYIQAAKNIKAKFSNAQFWLLGMPAKNASAIDVKDLQPFHEQGIIQLLHKTDDVNALLENVDVLILPSYYNEGVPKILLEGLSKGLPVITTNSVGCRETVLHETNGYLIEPKSIEALQAAIEKVILLSPAERGEMQKRSRLLAETEFDEIKVIETYLSAILT